MIPEEDIAKLRNELALLDVLNLELQRENEQQKQTIAGLSVAVASLRNDVNFQAKAMLEIARTVGMPVDGYDMSKLAEYIKERWYGAVNKNL